MKSVPTFLVLTFLLLITSLPAKAQRYQKAPDRVLEPKPPIKPELICLVPDIAVVQLRVTKVKLCATCPESLRILGSAQNIGRMKYIPSGKAGLILSVEDAMNPGQGRQLKMLRITAVEPGEIIPLEHIEPLPLSQNMQRPIFRLDFVMRYDQHATAAKYDNDCKSENNRRSGRGSQLVLP